VQGAAYQRAIATIRPEFTVVAEPCSLFVSLAEEGWTDGPIVEAIVHRYLDPMFAAHPQLDTLLLGCTHFPLLLNALRTVVSPSVAIVDSAATTAQALADDLVRRELNATSRQEPALSLMATDGAQRFARVGSRFLGQEVDVSQVELVDLAR
jgi:glutamate racemase